jgi:hypothetical protein
VQEAAVLERDAEVEPGERVVVARAGRVPERLNGRRVATLVVQRDAEVVPGGKGGGVRRDGGAARAASSARPARWSA